VFRNGRFSKKPAFERYSPGRKDARIGEAVAFLDGAAHLRNLTPEGLAAQCNLKLETAQRLLERAHAKRAERGE
jgi:hypothetical protein